MRTLESLFGDQRMALVRLHVKPFPTYTEMQLRSAATVVSTNTNVTNVSTKVTLSLVYLLRYAFDCSTTRNLISLVNTICLGNLRAKFMC